jgi:hypothetical protein
MAGCMTSWLPGQTEYIMIVHLGPSPCTIPLCACLFSVFAQETIYIHNEGLIM